MSSPKPTQVPSTSGLKVGVQISRETGGAYADMNEVIESELARIRRIRREEADDAEQVKNQVPRDADR